MTNTVTVLARAKVNLCLHVTGRRPGGYHLLDSLVVFPKLGDRVTAEPASSLSLSLAGAFGQELGTEGDNLALRAAALMPGGAALRLEKNLPVAAGIGGGSADAAATLRVLVALNGAALPPMAAILNLGADVPVCLRGRSARMRGIGDVVGDIPPLPPFWCVLVNPGVACPTPAVFRALSQPLNPGLPPLPAAFPDLDALFDYLAGTRNDLETPAQSVRPEVGTVLAALTATNDCALARMSGSGATCFGLYRDKGPALAAADTLRAAHPTWWVAAAPVSDDAGDDEIGEV